MSHSSADTYSPRPRICVKCGVGRVHLDVTWCLPCIENNRPEVPVESATMVGTLGAEADGEVGVPRSEAPMNPDAEAVVEVGVTRSEIPMEATTEAEVEGEAGVPRSEAPAEPDAEAEARRNTIKLAALTLVFEYFEANVVAGMIAERGKWREVDVAFMEDLQDQAIRLMAVSLQRVVPVTNLTSIFGIDAMGNEINPAGEDLFRSRVWLGPLPEPKGWRAFAIAIEYEEPTWVRRVRLEHAERERDVRLDDWLKFYHATQTCIALAREEVNLDQALRDVCVHLGMSNDHIEIRLHQELEGDDDDENVNDLHEDLGEMQHTIDVLRRERQVLQGNVRRVEWERDLLRGRVLNVLDRLGEGDMNIGEVRLALNQALLDMQGLAEGEILV